MRSIGQDDIVGHAATRCAKMCTRFSRFENKSWIAPFLFLSHTIADALANVCPRVNSVIDDVIEFG